MPISKIFHDHIVMSNVDKHGVKQILYPRTTSDDVMMRDGNGTVTNNILTDFLSDVVHESNLIDTLDKDTLKNSEDKYLGEHLLGDTEDKILLNRTPISDYNYTSPEISAHLDYDDKSIIVISRHAEGSGHVDISLKYDEIFNRHDVFYFELTNTGSSDLFIRLDHMTMKKCPSGNEKSMSTYDVRFIGQSQNPSQYVTVHPNETIKINKRCALSDVDYSTPDEIYERPTEYFNEVELEFKIDVSNSGNYRFDLHTFTGNVLLETRQFYAYNNVLANILSRLYRLENPPTVIVTFELSQSGEMGALLVVADDASSFNPDYEVRITDVTNTGLQVSLGDYVTKTVTVTP